MKPWYGKALIFSYLFGAGILPLHSVSAQPMNFSFGAIGQVVKTANDGAPLVNAIADSDADNLAFVVVDGFKLTTEPCTDELYQSRLDTLAKAKNGLILAIAASDWTECKNASGHATAIERLSRIRDVFFVDDFSLGASKIPLIRQSSAPKFRSFAENSRWEIGNVLFVSINLPANNNHYRTEAGRNSEFEDRLIANRDWLRRAFEIATRKKMSGIVLFCDGNPFTKPPATHLFESSTKHDGFAEFHQQLSTLTSKFPGKVLVIHNRSDSHAAHADKIAWHGNMGELELSKEWGKINVQVGNPTVFSAVTGASDAVGANQ